MNEFSTAIMHDQLSEGSPQKMFYIRLVNYIKNSRRTLRANINPTKQKILDPLLKTTFVLRPPAYSVLYDNFSCDQHNIFVYYSLAPVDVSAQLIMQNNDKI